MWVLLLVSLIAAFGSLRAARNRELHKFMWEENRKGRVRVGRSLDEENFAGAMRMVFWVMAGTSVIIGALAFLRILVPLNGR
jgi:hypothetical protein